MTSKAKLRGGLIVGIDLAGKARRETGYAVIDKELNTKTAVLHTDKEIASHVRDHGENVALVTIDAPLGLPRGRCCLDYGCECRRHGCMRVAEEQLVKLGIKVFPCGFGGMRDLTMRGIRIKEALENEGYVVIETYPGSAQDLLGIPRKGRNHKPLQEALVRYGFKGDVEKEDITDHELDAITSALVGMHYLRGHYIALGTPEESQIITVPPKHQTLLDHLPP